MVPGFCITFLYRGRSVQQGFDDGQTAEDLFVVAARVFRVRLEFMRLVVPGLGCWKVPGDAPPMQLSALRDKKILVMGCQAEDVREINKAVSKSMPGGHGGGSELGRIAEAQQLVDERALVAMRLIGTEVDVDMEEPLEEGEIPTEEHRPRRYFGRKAPLHWYQYGQPHVCPQSVLSKGFLEQVIGTQLLPWTKCFHVEERLLRYDVCAPCVMAILFQWGYFLFRHYELVLAVLEDDCRHVVEDGSEPSDNFATAIEEVTNRLTGLVEEVNTNRALEAGGTFYRAMQQLLEDLDFDLAKDIVANDPEDGCREDIISLFQCVALLDEIEYVGLDLTPEGTDPAAGSPLSSSNGDCGTYVPSEFSEQDWGFAADKHESSGDDKSDDAI